MLPPFETCTYTDFSDPDHAAAFEQALAKMRAQLGRTYPLVIAGEEIALETTFASINPSNLDEVIGHFADGTVEHGEAALQAAWDAFPDWAGRTPEDRAGVLMRAAALMRAERHLFSAAMVLEVGKTWPEADADTAEAIDFLEFYAREGVRWAKPQETTEYPGETNVVRYVPLGAGVAIPPWNFPVAIAAGMATAPIAAGNTMVLKPAEQSPLTSWLVFDLLRRAGLPKGVLNFVTCSDGAVVGGHLVQHPRTRFISFTGSKAVGCWIFEEAGKVRPGQIWLKRVVAEMGGKDAVLVDRDANLEAAADGIVRGAFGFQGQKCSAGSRALIHADVYDEIVPLIVAKARAVTVGSPEVNGQGMGPVIEQEALDRVLRYIDYGKEEGTLLVGGEAAPGNGHFVQATVFGDCAPDSRVASEEIFGPILALVKVADYAAGVSVFNGTEYGLTGAYFGIENIERAKRELFCGNLYINRKCTGALVDVQPFGGFNMSGTDAKAGGREHLLQFLQGKSICERLLI
ncbi:MAG: L-glutamate gamma-semialdehyde dehydrogenase [Deltaproteobacteria bacterium]|nr:L-glutamate gamma-semialdehyde dehydrogenase [Deltaproteobacteria bacterium]